MDLDPIKQLQSLFEDRGKVLEKISSIHAAIGSLKTDSAAPGLQSPPAESVPPQTTANPFFQPQIYHRLLRSLQEMQAQIEERVRPLAQQVVESEVAQLREQSGNQRALLNACLAQIDQCIVNCIGQIDEYQNKHAVLVTLNERIEKLGAAPEPLPGTLSPENVSAVIRARVEELRGREKF